MYNTACIEKLRVKNRGSENDGIILKNYWKWVLMHQECYFSKYLINSICAMDLGNPNMLFLCIFSAFNHNFPSVCVTSENWNMDLKSQKLGFLARDKLRLSKKDIWCMFEHFCP